MRDAAFRQLAPVRSSLEHPSRRTGGKYFNRESEAIWRARHGIDSTIDYLRWLMDRGTSSNAVFGAKIMWHQMTYCIQLLRQLPDYRSHNRGSIPELISTVFPNLFYVWITRSDKVRQAVSIDIALQTGNYAWIGDQKPSSKTEPEFNFNRIDFQMHRIVASELGWQQYFTKAGVTPFEVSYEEFVVRYEETTRAIGLSSCSYSGRSEFLGKPKLKKMSGGLNDEWVRRYHEIKARQPADNDRIRQRLAEWFVTIPKTSKQNGRNRLP